MNFQKVNREIIRRRWEARGETEKAAFVADMVRAGFNKKTVYNTINRLQETGTIDRKPVGGRMVKGWTEEKEKAMCQEADHEIGKSYTRLGLRYGMSDKTVKKYLERNNIHRYKRRNAPKVSEKQGKVQKTRLRKMTRTIFRAEHDDIDVIMDDEAYFDQNGMNFFDADHFFSSDPKQEPNEVKYSQKTKFPFKILVWVAISKRGRSSFLVKRTKGAVDSKFYIGKCLKPKLLPFIRKHYPDGKYIFWPDLASSHYSKDTQKFMREEEINFVPKDLNPPNVPNLRPIERFWSELKREVYAEGWIPKDEEELHQKVSKVMRKLGPTIGERYMSTVTQNVRLADRKGAFHNI